MKKIYKSILVVLTMSIAVSCSDDTDIAPFKPLVFAQGFSPDDVNFNYNGVFNFPGWTNFAEAGSKVWTERDFNNDGYIQFNPYGSGDASNIAWAITPGIELSADNESVLTFTSATNFVDNPANKLEVFISTNYNGTDVLAATWTQLNAVVADNTTNGYVYIPSGDISLADYAGSTVHIAFKVTGNGTTLDGLFQVDKVQVYSNN